MKTIDIVFDGPPGPTAGRFVEVEDESGASIGVGEWIERDDGFWALRIPDHRALTAEGARKDEVLQKIRNCCQPLMSQQEAMIVRWVDSVSGRRKAFHCECTVNGKQIREHQFIDGICIHCGDAADSSRCSYWAMVDKGRTDYPYEEHWRDCDVCQKRDPNRVEHRIAPVDSRQKRNPITHAEDYLCTDHGKFPCRDCGTTHFDGCKCYFCAPAEKGQDSK